MAKIHEVVSLKSGYANFVELKSAFLCNALLLKSLSWKRIITRTLRKRSRRRLLKIRQNKLKRRPVMFPTFDLDSSLELGHNILTE